MGARAIRRVNQLLRIAVLMCLIVLVAASMQGCSVAVKPELGGLTDEQAETLQAQINQIVAQANDALKNFDIRLKNLEPKPVVTPEKK